MPAGGGRERRRRRRHRIKPVVYYACAAVGIVASVIGVLALVRSRRRRVDPSDVQPNDSSVPKGPRLVAAWLTLEEGHTSVAPRRRHDPVWQTLTGWYGAHPWAASGARLGSRGPTSSFHTGPVRAQFLTTRGVAQASLAQETADLPSSARTRDGHSVETFQRQVAPLVVAVGDGTAGQWSGPDGVVYRHAVVDLEALLRSGVIDVHLDVSPRTLGASACDAVLLDVLVPRAADVEDLDDALRTFTLAVDPRPAPPPDSPTVHLIARPALGPADVHRAPPQSEWKRFPPLVWAADPTPRADSLPARFLRQLGSQGASFCFRLPTPHLARADSHLQLVPTAPLRGWRAVTRVCAPWRDGRERVQQYGVFTDYFPVPTSSPPRFLWARHGLVGHARAVAVPLALPPSGGGNHDGLVTVVFRGAVFPRARLVSLHRGKHADASVIEVCTWPPADAHVAVTTGYNTATAVPLPFRAAAAEGQVVDLAVTFFPGGRVVRASLNGEARDVPLEDASDTDAAPSHPLTALTYFEPRRWPLGAVYYLERLDVYERGEPEGTPAARLQTRWSDVVARRDSPPASPPTEDLDAVLVQVKGSKTGTVSVELKDQDTDGKRTTGIRWATF